MGREELLLGLQAGQAFGDAVAQGVAEWRQLQRDRKDREAFNGAMSMAAQRRAMIKSAAGVEDAGLIQALESQLQRYPNAEQTTRQTGNLRKDNSPETERIVRTPEGEISLDQLDMLKQRKQQAESNAELAEVDLLQELQAQYPDNRYIAQWVASSYLGIKQKRDIRVAQIQAQSAELEMMKAAFEREKFEQEKLKYKEEPGRKKAEKTFDSDEQIRVDAARIEAEKRAKLETDAASAQNQPAKPPTVEQSKAATFARRMEQALGELDSIDYDRTALSAGAESSLPRFAQSEGLQRLQQAEENFLTAVLRKESGAVINEQEFARDGEKYFVRAGDKPEQVKQKARARRLALEAIKAEAGPAYDLVPKGETAAPAAAGDVPPDIKALLEKY